MHSHTHSFPTLTRHSVFVFVLTCRADLTLISLATAHASLPKLVWSEEDKSLCVIVWLSLWRFSPGGAPGFPVGSPPTIPECVEGEWEARRRSGELRGRVREGQQWGLFYSVWNDDGKIRTRLCVMINKVRRSINLGSFCSSAQLAKRFVKWVWMLDSQFSETYRNGQAHNIREVWAEGCPRIMYKF